MAHVVLFMQIKNDSLQETDAEDELLALTVKTPEVHTMFRNSKKGLSVFLASLWTVTNQFFSLRNPKGFGWHIKESCLKCRLCAKNCDRQELISGNILWKWVRLKVEMPYISHIAVSVLNLIWSYQFLCNSHLFHWKQGTGQGRAFKTMALFV